MPSQIIHLLAARAAMDQPVDKPIDKKDLVTASFNFGCQGPDVFSHNRRTKPLALSYARLLHRHDYGRFCASVADSLLTVRAPYLLSWFCGFVTHQAVDRVFHPYIVNRSFVPGQTGIPGVSPALFHAFLERVLDVKLLEYRGFGPVSSLGLIDSFRLSDDLVSGLASLIAPALRATYPAQDKEDTEAEQRVKNAFVDTLYFYELSDPVHTALARTSGVCDVRKYSDLGTGGVALLYPETADPAIDWLNLAKAPWAHPVSGIWNPESVPELFDRAVEQATSAISLLTRFLAGSIDSVELEEGISNDCLSVSGLDGRIGAVQFYEPFDIARVLLEETEKRRQWFDRMIC